MSLTTAELEAIHLALKNQLLLQPPEKVLILSESRGALQQLINGHKEGIIARRIATQHHEVEEVAWDAFMQWVPFHGNTSGNERAVLSVATTRS